MRHGIQAERCIGCRLHTAVCICSEVEAAATRLQGLLRTRVVLVTHAKELRRSTNTGFLLERVLRCEVRVRGAMDQDCELWDLVAPGAEALMLYPEEDGRVLAVGDRPSCLVVADGSWRQATRMVNRDPALSRLERVTLPPGPPGRYRLREAPRADGLCTLEAVARALELTEGERGPELRSGLETLLDAQVRATLQMRGQG
ncbi:MAG: tRNA-uridine aminocarboxypropyltransferase [bacterium]